MKATPIVLALAMLGALTLQVHAQTVPPAPAPAPAPAPDDIGNTGTGTGTESVGNTGTGTGTESVGNTGTGTGTESVGNTGTGTGTTITGTESVGNTGTGTGTNTVVMSAAPLAVSLSAQNSSMPSNSSQPVTVSAVVGAESVQVTSGTATIPLSSSNPACKVPASVELAWNSKEGGAVTFQVTCSKISGKAQTVTLTGGNASTSFTLKP